MKYIIQQSILDYLFSKKLLTADEYAVTEKALIANSEKNKEIFKKDLTNKNFDDILLTVDKNSTPK